MICAITLLLHFSAVAATLPRIVNERVGKQGVYKTIIIL